MPEAPRRPFNINQQQGVQADAVRSKIATLMDGVTVHDERRPLYSQPQQPVQPVSPLPLVASPMPPTPPTSTMAQDKATTPSMSFADSEMKGGVTDGVTSRIAGTGLPSVQPSVQTSVQPKNETPIGGDFDKTGLGAETADLSGEPLPGAVNIKGRAGGVLIEIGKGHWPDLIIVLADRLTRAANFFRNGKVALDLGLRSLSEQELRKLYHLLAQHHLTLSLIRTASADTFQLALGLGLAAQLEQAESKSLTAAQPTLSNIVEEQHFIYSGHLRAGQVLQRPEHILVVGDVNPGATVISDGDILVWGRLRGVAHAGANGDGRAVIVALDLSPVQLRIHEMLAIAPEAQHNKGWGPWKRSVAKQPEIAYLAGNEIVVETWEATKFGGIATLRR